MKELILNEDKLKDKEIDDYVTRVKAIIVNDKKELLLGLSYNDYQFPGGHLEKDEEPVKGLIRELKEETGYSSENLEWILTIRTTVAFCDERIEVFVARNLIPGEQSLDEDEFVDVKAYELDELKQMIFEGKIQDSKTMAAILAYESKYLHG